MTNAAETFSKNGGFAFRVVAGEAVLAPIRGGVSELGSIFTLNEVGAEIWRLIDGARSSDEIALAVCEQFEVSPEQATRDVRSFLKRLLDRGLVTAVTNKERAPGLP